LKNEITLKEAVWKKGHLQ